jgi:hypothetical protein
MSDTDKAHGFFAVDRRTWARVCGLGLNGAVAYLVERFQIVNMLYEDVQ